MLDIDKLVAFVGDKIEITVEDIKTLVNQSLEYKIFELTDALSKKDSNKVFAIIEDMKGKKEEYKTLPALIYSHFRRLFMIAINKSATNYELSQMLGIKEFAVKMSQNQVGLFSKSSLKKINDLCSKLDFDLKQSNISIDNYINVLILTILNLK
jgi:DNA polymerase-3 subunit delta